MVNEDKMEFFHFEVLELPCHKVQMLMHGKI